MAVGGAEVISRRGYCSADGTINGATRGADLSVDPAPHHAYGVQSSALPPIDFISSLVDDELQRRADRLIKRRIKLAAFRDSKTLDGFDFGFNKKMDRRMVFDLASGRFIAQHEDALFLGPPGTGKSHLAQAIGRAAIQQGHCVIYREAHVLLEQIAEATAHNDRRTALDALAATPLLIIATSECASCLPRLPRTCWSSSCGVTRGPAP